MEKLSRQIPPSAFMCIQSILIVEVFRFFNFFFYSHNVSLEASHEVGKKVFCLASGWPFLSLPPSNPTFSGQKIYIKMRSGIKYDY